jgi:hypothetical protein
MYLCTLAVPLAIPDVNDEDYISLHRATSLKFALWSSLLIGKKIQKDISVEHMAKGPDSNMSILASFFHLAV